MIWERVENATVGELIENMIDQKLRIRDLERQRDTLIGWDDQRRACNRRIEEIREELTIRAGE